MQDLAVQGNTVSSGDLSWLRERRKLIKTFNWMTSVVVCCSIAHQWTFHGLDGVSPWAFVLAIPYAPFVMFLTTGLVVHELGHAVAAWLCGMRVFSISLGSYDEPIWKQRFCGVKLELRPYPLDAYIHAGHRELRWLRTRECLMTLGGPLANACVCAGSLGWFFAAHMNWQSFGGGLLLFIGATNAFRFLFNMFPRQMASGGGPIPSDGLAMLQTLRMNKDDCEHYHVDYFLSVAGAAAEQGDLSDALDGLQKGLALYPKNVTMGVWLAAYLLEAHRYEDARDVLTRFLKHGELTEAEEHQLCVYLVWTNLATEDSSLLREADEASQVAIRMGPDDFASRCARGCVLVALNQVDEGTRLLEAAMSDNASPEHKSIAVAYLAIAAIKSGHYPEARRLIETGRSLDWTCIYLRNAERQLTQARSRPSAELDTGQDNGRKPENGMA